MCTKKLVMKIGERWKCGTEKKKKKKKKTKNKNKEVVDGRGSRGREADCGMIGIALIRRLLYFGVWHFVVWYKIADLLAERAA